MGAQIDLIAWENANTHERHFDAAPQVMYLPDFEHEKLRKHALTAANLLDVDCPPDTLAPAIGIATKMLSGQCLFYTYVYL